MSEVKRIFDLQKEAYSPGVVPDYWKRMNRLNRLENMVRENIDNITKALQSDFGTRSAEWIFVAEIYPVLDHLKHVKKNLKKWMKKENRGGLMSAVLLQKEYIINEPLGVIGIMSPFNAPVSLALDPAIEAIAGGNNVVIKISENTPATAELVKKMIGEYFKEEELASVTGGIDVSMEFTGMPWDKFFFTGGSEVGKKVLEATAKNLTPAILELGGKSPCVILDDADVEEAAIKIGKVRVLNGGQVCIGGDYVFVKENQLESFIHTIKKSIGELYPSIIDNESFTSICYKGAYDRIVSYIKEAEESGCRVIKINPKNENVPDKKTRKIPLTLVINPPKDLMVSKYEIFGPILSIFTYNHIEYAISEINRREKPLALYIFGKDKKKINYVVNNTSSGGVTVNDLLMHANAQKMGFGGVGYSGMGRYKGGFIGYQAFTNPKAVVEMGLMGKFTGIFMPPFKNERTAKILKARVKVKF